jgi:protein involved in polysaccharide export with SLBB domain
MQDVVDIVRVLEKVLSSGAQPFNELEKVIDKALAEAGGKPKK